jgi:tellurite resistance protein
MVWLLVQLCIDYPPLGLAVVGGIVVYGVVRYVRNPDRSTRKALEEMAASQNAPPDLSGLSAIQARDPAFDPDRFLARVRSTVDNVNMAWCAQDMAPARRIISDAVYMRFRTQLQLNARQGFRNVMADVEIGDITIVSVEVDGDWDTIHVKLHARARDADVPTNLAPEEAAKKIRGAPLEPYWEIWSFSRRAGAKTLAAGALDGKCPKCGAEVPLVDVVRCEFCKSLVNSGVHDWVLAEITQVVEWRPSSTGRAIVGMQELRARDPGFNREQVEDRASVLFWKWIEARMTAEPKRLARFAAVSPAELGVMQGAPPELLDRVAVGSADLVGCDPAPVGERDRCYVKVLWSAARNRASEPIPIASVLVLARAAGVTTREGLSSLACKECNGPLGESDEMKCSYCGASLAPGAQEWALEAVATPEAAERARFQRMQGVPATNGAIDIPDLRDPRERVMLLWRMAALFAADGQIDPRERKLLEQMARRWGVQMATIAPALQPGVDVGQLGAVPEPDRLPFLAALVVAALVDGRVDGRERKLLDSVCDSLQLPRATVDQLIRSGGRIPRAQVA